MKEHKVEVKYYEVAIDSMSPLEFELMKRATDAAKTAYAPYSGFHVGVALMLTNGKIVTGSNQENAAYPSGLCAERVALYVAATQYPGIAVREMAIVAMKDGVVANRISPCGSCRQVMGEFEKNGNTPMRILLCGNEKVHVVVSAASLLPLTFTSEDLGK